MPSWASTVQACASKSLNPGKVGDLYDIKASSLDIAIQKAFTAAIAGSPVTVVAEGQDFFTPAGGLKAVQDMLTAHSDLSAVVGSDQGIEGAVQALASANKTGKVRPRRLRRQRGRPQRRQQRGLVRHRRADAGHRGAAGR